MKNKELFNRTIGILVKAHFEGTLIHGDQCGCAVGNLVAGNMGFDYKGKSPKFYSERQVFGFWFHSVHNLFSDNKDDHRKGRKEIESTGYLLSEVVRIEEAFERGVNLGLFQSLMSVVDTLMLIHEANETEVKQAKELFVLA